MTQRTGQVVRVGVIGLGFMGATHVAAYRSAARDGYPCELVAVCDRKTSRREGKLWDVGGNIGDTSEQSPAFDSHRIRAYAHADDLLKDQAVDLVSICTQTDTHADLAIRALRAGKHVLVEKPVAIRADDVRRVAAVAQEVDRLCMPGMCMRFWPGWTWLKERIDRRTFGRCTALTLTRIGSAPSWSTTFYSDPERSGGALVDLHIHDADFVRFLFGEPTSVMSAGNRHGNAINHVTTMYRFDGRDREHAPSHVVAEGAWLSPGTKFRMRFVAGFERATADYDLNREQQLLLYRNGEAEAVEISTLTGHQEQVRHLIRAIVDGRRDLRATLADAVADAELLDAERRSIESGRPVDLPAATSTLRTQR